MALPEPKSSWDVSSSAGSNSSTVMRIKKKSDPLRDGTIATRILAALDAGPKTRHQLADELGAKNAGIISNALSKLRGRGIIRRGRCDEWILLAQAPERRK